jgi:hypothetical protein
MEERGQAMMLLLGAIFVLVFGVLAPRLPVPTASR